MHYCPNCGERLSDNMKFCPNCGVDAYADHRSDYSCPRCGESLQANERFCHRCGLFLLDESPDTESVIIDPEPEVKKSPGSWIFNALSSLLRVVVIIVIIYAIGTAVVNYLQYRNGGTDPGADDEYVTFIRNSAPLINQDVTYGEAFTKFFANRKWSHYTDDDGNHIVEFTGNCTYAGDVVTVTLIFSADIINYEGSFDALFIDGVLQDEFTKLGFLMKVFDV